MLGEYLKTVIMQSKIDLYIFNNYILLERKMIKNYKCAKLMLLMVLASSLVGCGEAVNFNDKPLFKDNISSRKTWTVKAVTSECRFKNLNAILDNNNNTYMNTEGDYKGASLIIDLKRICVFNEIVIRHGAGKFAHGHAGIVGVYASMDGKKYKFVKAFPGTRSYTYFTLLTPVTARYIKLKVSKPGKYPWTISNILIQ